MKVTVQIEVEVPVGSTGIDVLEAAQAQRDAKVDRHWDSAGDDDDDDSDDVRQPYPKCEICNPRAKHRDRDGGR